MWKFEDEARTDLEKVDTLWIHNVARYAHSYKTNTTFTRRVVEFIIAEHEWFAKHVGDTTGYRAGSPQYFENADSLKSQLWQIKMSETYSDEAIARADIMQSLVSFSTAAAGPRLTTTVLQQDGRAQLNIHWQYCCLDT